MASTDQHRPANDSAAARLGRRLLRGARRLTPTLADRPLWMRVVSTLVGLVWIFGAWIVLGFFSVPSRVDGWLPTIAALLPGMLLLTLGGGLTRSRGSQVVAALVLASLLGGWTWYSAAPDFERLRATAADVGTPAGWHLHGEQVLGNTWGLWASWPELTLTYGTSQSPEEAAATLSRLLEDEGWDRDDSTDPRSASVTWRHWDRSVAVRVEAPGAESRDFDTGPGSVPEDLTKVTLVYR